mmetsp:Transcript_8064/g.7211  ORF Transcript_8064/g.7211 Transcript_8064/m.7211 type:complete len:285 (-) Transcript_8064:129-983(-)
MGGSIASLLFQPPEISYAHAKKHIIWLKTKKHANIPAFYIDRRSSVTFLFSHGNAEDIGMIYEWFCEFTRELNVNLLAYDYEGYGKAGGTPSESNCYDDIDAAYHFLTTVLHISPTNIIIYGRSVGSGPSTYLAERLSKEGVKIGGLILQSALLSVFRVAFNFRFTFPGDMFPNGDRIGNIRCPFLAIHGTRDEIVPFWNGETLFFNAPVQWRARPIWVEGGGHNNIESLLRENGMFFDLIREFLREWVPSYAGQADNDESQDILDLHTSSKSTYTGLSLRGTM